MKTKKLFFTSLLCCLLVGLSTATFATVKQDRNVGAYTKISVSGGIDLHLTQGSANSVAIETDEAVVDKIETIVENGTLTIRVKKGERFNRKNGMLTIVAYVTASEIEAIQGSGGSDIHLQTPINSSENLEIAISGGSDFKNAQLNAPVINIKQSGGSDGNFTVNTTTLNVAASGGSDVTLNGKTNTIAIIASGGSDVKAGNLQYEKSDVSKSGGSDIRLKK